MLACRSFSVNVLALTTTTTGEDFQARQETGSDLVQTKHHATRREQLVCGLQTVYNFQFTRLIILQHDFHFCWAGLLCEAGQFSEIGLSKFDIDSDLTLVCLALLGLFSDSFEISWVLWLLPM
jgi:hypothetical protein